MATWSKIYVEIEGSASVLYNLHKGLKREKMFCEIARPQPKYLPSDEVRNWRMQNWGTKWELDEISDVSWANGKVSFWAYSAGGNVDPILEHLESQGCETLCMEEFVG